MPRAFTGIDVRGVNKIIARMETLEQALINFTEHALEQEAKDTIEEARPMVPMDTGALRSSGFVEEPERHVSQVNVTAGYGRDDVINPIHGNPTSNYAWDQHETMEYYHDDGEAKYLEKAVFARFGYMRGVIQSRMNAFVARKTREVRRAF